VIKSFSHSTKKINYEIQLISTIPFGVCFMPFPYQASMTATNQSGTTNSFSARVINGMFQVPLLYEYNFKTEKLSPFIRFGLMAHGTIIPGINSRIRSRSGVPADLPPGATVGPSSGSVRLVNTKLDNRTLRLSPMLETGTFGNSKGIPKWDISLGVVPHFSVPEYSILYSFDDVPKGVRSPSSAVITQLKFRYYLK
jgi:hypothetical protein